MVVIHWLMNCSLRKPIIFYPAEEAGEGREDDDIIWRLKVVF